MNIRNHLTSYHQQKITNGQSKVLEIHREDLEEFFNNENDSELIHNIFKNTKRYIGLFSEAADNIMPERHVLTDIMAEEVYYFFY